MDLAALAENEHMRAVSALCKNIGETIEGNLICDIHPDNSQISRNIDKIRNLQSLCKSKTKILEIGVNACHSLLLMLSVNPSAEYVLFDLNNHSYTAPTVNYVKTAFPDTKITFIPGDSVQTVGNYILENPNVQKTFDFIHIDGGHTFDVFSHDYSNAKKLITNGGVVVFDDFDLPAIHTFLQEKIKSHEIVENEDVIKTALHCVYSYEE